MKNNKGQQKEGKNVPPKEEKAENPQHELNKPQQASGAEHIKENENHVAPAKEEPIQRKVSGEAPVKQETAKPVPKNPVSTPVQMKDTKPEAQPKKVETANLQKESAPSAGKKETPAQSAQVNAGVPALGVKQDKEKPAQGAQAGEDKKVAKDPEVVAMVDSVLGEKTKSDSKKNSPVASVAQINKKSEMEPQKEAKAPATGKSKGDTAGGGQKDAAPAAEVASPDGMSEGKKPASKPVSVKINGGDPGQIMEQLANVPPAAAIDAFSQAVAVSGGALEKQRQKTQQVIPSVPAPTGLAPTKTAGKGGEKVETINHSAPEGFKSEKSGGKAYEGTQLEFSAGSGKEEDPDAIMAEARALSGQAPQISMEGEADPSQATGFKAESDQSMQAAKQAELAQVKVAFKAIEAASGKSIVDLVRQYIPFADKLINKIAESGPVQGLLKPLEQPVNYVGGVIDDVSERAIGMVDDTEQKTVGSFGNGAKLLTSLAGVSLGGKKKDGPGEDKKDEKGGGGGFLGAIKSGIHTRLMALGAALLKKGTNVLKTVGNKTINKIKGLIIGRKVNFKIGSEDHELWVEKQGSKNVVMMTSEQGKELSKVVANVNVDNKNGNTIQSIKNDIAEVAPESIGELKVNEKLPKMAEGVAKVLTEALNAYRAELGVPDKDTVAVGKTDVPGLEGLTFKGASPGVRTEARLLKLDEIAPNREIKSPSPHPRGRNHAEEGVIHEFIEAVKNARLKSDDVKGTLYIHQSNPTGVCPTCIQGLDSGATPGIFKQFSQRYPKLTIKATSEGSEGVRAVGRQSFVVKNGKYIG